MKSGTVIVNSASHDQRLPSPNLSKELRIWYSKKPFMINM